MRGYPPRPGQPDPVYPPGQFSSWNRASLRAAWLGSTGAATGSGEAEADPGYSALALSDAAADLTATQSWAVIDDEPLPGPSAARRTRRDWGSHVEDAGPGRQRSADPGRDAPSRAAGGRTAGPRSARGAGGQGTGLSEHPAAGPDTARPAATGSGATRRGDTRLAAAGIGAAAALGASAALGGAASGLAGAERTAPSTLEPGTDTDGIGGGSDRGPGTATGDRVLPAKRRGAKWQSSADFGEPEPRRRSRTAAPERTAPDSDPEPSERRSGKRGGRRHSALMYGLLLVPVLIVILVVAGYVYVHNRHAPATPHAGASSHHPAASKSPAAALGRWKHIESRSLDSVPLSVTELFPAKFSKNSQAGTLTVSKASSNCSHEVFGTKLAAAIRKADCTQVLRASYLSTDRKIMATVGVLNLESVSWADQAGQAAGSTEFIKQLPSRHGPTRNIAKGTGIVEADIKGHYLILTWTEFTNLRAPSGKSQRLKLEAFSAGLIAGTVNVSLTNRMLTGHPPAAPSKS